MTAAKRAAQTRRARSHGTWYKSAVFFLERKSSLDIFFFGTLMFGGLLLCGAEFDHLTHEVAKLTSVYWVENAFQPSPGTTVGSLRARSPAGPIRIDYVNGSVHVDAHGERASAHLTVKEAIRFIRQILHLDALKDLLNRHHAN